MATKTVDVIVQRVGYECPGSELGWDVIASPNLHDWIASVGLTDDETHLFVTVTGEETWSANVVAYRTIKVDVLVWAQVRLLEAERLREEGRTRVDAVEAYRIVREVETEVTSHLRSQVRASVTRAWEAHDLNYSRTGDALGMTDTAVRKWVSG